MKQYFELKDGNSSKFWEIEISNTDLTTRYGKIGTEGKITTKSFETTEKAQKEYNKLIKEKTDKGYQEKQKTVLVINHIAPKSPAEKAGLEIGDVIISYNSKALTTLAEYQALAAQNTTPKVSLTIQRAGEEMTLEVTKNTENQIGFFIGNVPVAELKKYHKAQYILSQEAEKRFQLKKNDYVPYKLEKDRYVVLFEGDIEIDGNFELTLSKMPADALGYVVTGNLTVKDRILDGDMDYGPFLVVLGNLEAGSISTAGAVVYIKGNANIYQYIYTYYNHGLLTIEGDLDCPVTIVNDHATTVKGDVNTFFIDENCLGFVKSEPDFDEENIHEILAHEVIAQGYIDDGILMNYIREKKNFLTKKYAYLLGDTPNETKVTKKKKVTQNTPSTPIEKLYITSITPESVAEKYGFQFADVMMSVNGKNINNLEDFDNAITETTNGNYEIVVRRKGIEIQIDVKKEAKELFGFQLVDSHEGHLFLIWDEFNEVFEPMFEMPFGDFAKEVPIKYYEADAEGNIYLEGDFEHSDSKQNYNIVFDGNVVCRGNFNVNADGGGNFVLVTGNLEAHLVEVIGCATLEVRGNVDAENGIVTMYGDDGGYLTIHGEITAPFLLNGFYFNLETFGTINAITIDYSSNGMNDPDYERDTIEEIVIPELLEADGDLNTKKFFEYTRQHKPVLKNQVSISKTTTTKFTNKKPEVITKKEAQKRFNLKKYGDMDDFDYSRIIAFDGDTFIEGSLNFDWAERFFEEHDEDINSFEDPVLILVNGNLTATNEISPGGDAFPFLLVIGNVECDVLRSYDEFIHITGNANVRYAFQGDYNDGSICIEGVLRVPYVLNGNHNSVVRPEGAILINYYDDSDDFFEYDYTIKDFENVLVKEVLDKQKLDIQKFVERLKAGKEVLKKGAKPARQIFEEELEKISVGNTENIEELDLAGKKFKQFPKQVLKFKNLKKLDLSANAITSVPENIGELKNLEILYLSDTDIKTLPDEIGELKKLKVLNISQTSIIKLPKGIGNLKNLEEFYLNGCKMLEQLPEGLKNLKKLRLLNMSHTESLFNEVLAQMHIEELEAVKCSDEKPVDFPEIITSIKTLKKLNIGSNSFKGLPESFVNLKNLEELNLDRSLGYFSSFPDLSSLKKLKKLVFSGNSWYTNTPAPLQSLIQNVFKITSLEELHLDRFGEEKDIFKEKEFDALLENLTYDPKRQADIKKRFKAQKEKNMFYGTMWEGKMRDKLTIEDLKGIGNLKKLRFLDLSFNGLEKLPEEVFKLKNIDFINFNYNKLGGDIRKRLHQTFPKAQFDFSNNNVEGESENAEWKEMNELIKEANKLMNTHNDKKKLLKSLDLYERVLDFFRTGKVVDEYNYLYAHYGKVWAYCYLLSNCQKELKPEMYKKYQEESVKFGLQTLSLIPTFIWHYTDLGRFHEEVTRIASNQVAWQMYLLYDDEAHLKQALEIIEKGVKFIQNDSQYFIWDTKVRILMKMKREEEAFAIVCRILNMLPSFGDFQDFKTNPKYIDWVKKIKNAF
ncbi:MAG: PDZ domain-containing protein [Raineya sp.]|jgi:Leucine-rich repeat (LRR) protein/predicted DNA-binding WGR domain protein|nr:PDZ domain-containing protein [Raineya sp.]